MSLSRPLPGEYAEGYAPYIAEAGEGDALVQLQGQLEEAAALFGALSESQGAFRYAPGKWSLKDLLLHLSDAERIFAYRCLRIGRGDTTPMPGFDEDAYVAAARADSRSMASLVADWRAVRTASLTLFQDLPDGAWGNQGTTNNRTLTARCIPYIALGHAAHHLRVVRERYLPALK
ncbi:MAG: DinB family protein [Geothrix sp.]|nr:DinB family protein [Geothrix sp.]